MQRCDIKKGSPSGTGMGRHSGLKSKKIVKNYTIPKYILEKKTDLLELNRPVYN